MQPLGRLSPMGSKPAFAVAEDGDLLDDLLARTACGDQPAFRALYDRAGPRLFAICLRLARERSLAEDLLQEACSRVWERAPQFDPRRGSALAWMIAITRNHAIDVLRQRARERAAPEEAALDIADPGALDGMESRVELRAVKRCFGELDDGPRRAILLAYQEGLSYEELSATLRIPVGTAKTWVRRGLLRLRQCLEKPR